MGPDGEGDNTIVAFAPGDRTRALRLVEDPELSPLDLTLAPNGNVVVSSEHPFGAPDAVTTVREYDTGNGRLVRVFSASGLAEFRRPRGLRFAADGHLYCVAEDEVVAFDFAGGGGCLGAIVRWPRLYGQALDFFPTWGGRGKWKNELAAQAGGQWCGTLASARRLRTIGGGWDPTTDRTFRTSQEGGERSLAAQAVPDAWFCPCQQPLHVGAVAADDIDAPCDDQQPVGQWLLQAADEDNRCQRRQYRAKGDDPEHRQHEAKNRQGA